MYNAADDTRGERLPLILVLARLVLSLLTLHFCSCTPSGRPSKVGAAAKLSGDVFIVTKGGASIKLGLVPVAAFAESAMVAHVRKKDSELPTITRQTDSLLALARREIAIADGATRQAELYHKALAKKFDYRPTPEQQKQLDRAWEAYLHSPERGNKARARARELLETGKSLGSMVRYFDGLPTPMALTKSDADGKFELDVPANQRIAVAARAERLVGNETEKYHWLIWVTCSPDRANRVFLSNDNLMEVPSGESVVAVSERLKQNP